MLGLWTAVAGVLAASATSAPALGQEPSAPAPAQRAPSAPPPPAAPPQREPSPPAPAPSEQPPPEEPAPDAAAPVPTPAEAAAAAPEQAAPEQTVAQPAEQEVPAASAATPSSEMTVTGTRVRLKSAFTPSAPVQVVDRKQLELTGATNLADVVQNLTVAQGSGFQGEGAGQRDGRIGVTGVNLRGLGFGATLVLVNGRRLPLSAGTAPGGEGATADLGQIPLAAVDRIEILKGGASAIYGSDAIAGVVNIITRKNWDGLNVGIEGQAADRFDFKSYNVNAAFGAVGSHARLTGALSWDLHTDLNTNQRDWTKYGQLDSPIGYPGTFLVGTTTMPDPNCSMAPRAHVISLPGQGGPSNQCGYSDRDFEVLIPAVQRGNVFMNAEYDLTQHTTAFIEGNFSHMRGDSQLWPFFPLPPFSIVVPANHVDNPFGQSVLFNGRVTDMTSRLGAEDDTLRLLAGLKGDFAGVAANTFLEDWEWQLGTSWGASRYRSVVTDNIVPALQTAIDSCSNPADLSGCFNPFYSSRLGTGTPNSDAVLQKIRAETSSVTDSGQRVYDAGMNGSLFNLPGGKVGMAVGGEIRHEWRESDADHDSNIFDLGLTVGLTDYVVKRDVYGSYLELRWPILAGVELQTAGRVDYYSDIKKSAANPTLGITVSPADIAGRDRIEPLFRRLQFRAHASTAFRAPEILDSSRASTVVPTQLQIGQGLPSFLPIRTNGNPSLGDERALALSAGVVWTLIDELNLLGDFWHYQYKDRIGPEDPAQKVAAWQSAMANQGGACVTDSPGVIVNAATCTVKEIDITDQNTRGTTLTNGIDFGLTVNLTGKTFGGSADDWGTISVGAQGTYTLSYDLPRNAILEAVIAQGIVKCDGNSPTSSCSVVGNRNSNNIAPPVPRLRANFPISWLYRGHAVSFIAHYTSPLEDDNDAGRPGVFGAHIDSFFTMDLQYGYTVKDWIGDSLTIRVGVINLADQAPPAVTSERWGYEPLLYDPRGRVLYAKLTSKF